MFLCSIRLSRKKVLVTGLAAVLAVGLCTAGARALRVREDPEEAAPVSEPADPTSKAPAKARKITAKTEEERIAFLQSFGWEVADQPPEVEEVIIPAEFDAVYTDYNATQQAQGFDLEPYAGKRCKRYSYVIANYPDCPDEVRANLLLYKDRIIGGDVCSVLQDGFLHGFSKNE